MALFNVHVYAEIRQKFNDVEAPTQKDACLAAMQTDRFRKWMDHFRFEAVKANEELPIQGEYAEGIPGFLVDVPGDTEYNETRFFYDTGDAYVGLAQKIIAWADDNNRSMATMLTLADELRSKNLQTV